VDEVKATTKENIKLQCKRDDLKQDCTFYEKQIDDMKDMNIYLKYKLKLFLGDIQEETENSEKEKKNNQVNNNDMEESKKNSLNYNKNSDKNKEKEKKEENKYIKENIIKEEETNIKESKETEKNEEEEEEKLYITATKNLYNSNKKKKDKKYGEFNEVEYLNSKLNLEESQLMNYLHLEKEKNYKLSQLYNKLNAKTSNPYFSALKDIIDEQKSINMSKSLEKSNNMENNMSNRSIMPSIYSSTLSMSNSSSLEVRKQFYTPENPGYGFINRKENKEIMLSFLENIETKKLIYNILYGE
jgi:hypothetical protein